MKRTTRLLAGAFAALAMTVGLTATTTNTAAAVGTDASPRDYEPYDPATVSSVPIAYPGMFIDFTGDMSPRSPTDTALKYYGKYCTLGVVGTDSAGRKIGITAGHCNEAQLVPDPANPGQLKKPGQDANLEPCTSQAACVNPDYPKYPGVKPGTSVTNNDHPVYDFNAVNYAQKNNKPQVNPIGWVRWVDANGLLPDGEQNLETTTDYMVIEFAPEVQLSSQVRDKDGNAARQSGGGLFKVNSIYSGAGGAPALPPIAIGLNTSTWIENYGARSDRTPDIFSVGVNRGAVGAVNNGIIRSYAANKNGDSGGPVVMNGTGKWVGITFSAVPGLVSPYSSTSAKNILDNLNSRNDVGSGFVITNN